MNKSWVFAKRNLKEILRDPLSLIFNFVFPILMLTLFFCFTWGQNEANIIKNTPMFAPDKIIPAIAVFGFSFLTLFGGMLVAKDRSTAFIDRLRTSPMKPVHFFLGYAIPLFIIALIQVVITYLIGFLYSLGFSAELQFNIFSINALASIFISIPIAIFFISAGIFFGFLVSIKTIGGISSLLINIAAISSGMFMPIYTMGWFKTICQALPFYHSVSLAQDVCGGNWPSNISFYDSIVEFYKTLGMAYSVNILDTWWMHVIIIIIYTVAIVIASVLTFKKKLTSN